MDLQITRIAEQLTIKFADELDIPNRFKRRTIKPTKINADSLVEIRFKRHVDAWTALINSIIKGTKDKEQAWRFIRVQPQVNEQTSRLIDCKDFMDFLDYLIKRRSVDNCDDEELGKLSMLQTAFQRQVEKRIGKE
jgi:hypothetical protein